MKVMKSKSFVFILLILSSLLYLSSVGPSHAQTSTSVLPPKFLSVSVEENGQNVTYTATEDFTIDISTGYKMIYVKYYATRYVVDGVMILGSGSGLSENITQGLNLTKVNSHRNLTYFEGALNITSYTKFYAYAWSGSLSNGTREEIEPFNHLGSYHYVFVTGQQLPPTLISVTGNYSVQLTTTKYYTPLNSNVTLRYVIENATGTETPSVVFATNRSRIYDIDTLPHNTNPSAPLLYERNLTLISYDSTSKLATYELNVTLPTHTLYFAARSNMGWEMDKLSHDLLVNELTNGFSLEASRNVEVLTQAEPLYLGLLARNYTSQDTFYLAYQITPNATSINENDNITIPWNIAQLPTPTNQSTTVNVEQTINGSTTVVGTLNVNVTITTQNNYTNIVTYNVTMGYFEVNTSISYYFYSLYFDNHINETNNPYSLTVIDGTPTAEFTVGNAKHNYYFSRSTNITLTYKFSTPKGALNGAYLYMNSTFLKDVLKDENYTYTFTGEGLYNFTLFVNNSVGLNYTTWLLVTVDHTPPIIHAISPSNNTVYNIESRGHVVLSFTYADNQTFADTGILQVLIDWGDGVQVDATNLTTIDHTYYKSGTYTITITVFDRAGNNASVILIIQVFVPVTSESTTVATPFTTPLVYVLSLLVLIPIYRKRKQA